MTGTEIVNILKSPTSKVLMLGILLIAGAFILIPILSRDDKADAVVQEKELSPEEKAPMDIGTNIPKFKVDRAPSTEQTELPPPVINQGKISAVPKRVTAINSVQKTPSAPGKKDISNPERKAGVFDARNRRGMGRPDNSAQSRIFVLSAAQNNSKAVKDEPFLSERYAPYGRLLDCKLVNTLESNISGTPLIAVVINDLWWTNSQGKRKLIIPAGTEVHGKMGSCVRNRMMCDGSFVLVWQITSGQVGMELQLKGRILEKSNQAGNKNKATITDMAAGIPGRVMGNANLNEMLQYTMAFAQGLSSGFQTTKTFDNGSAIITESDGSTKTALARAFETMSNVALENITDKISKESYYIRVPAGTEFYLYIEQVTDVEKAAIADTALNSLEETKLKKEKDSSDDVAQASKLHDAIGGIFPKSLQKELKGIR